MKRLLSYIQPTHFIWGGLFLIVLLASAVLLSRPARAATFTICASGCDYTTLTAANAANPMGNATFLIQATYDPSTETYPISLNNTNIIYDCQNSGAVIGIASGGQRVMAIGYGNTLRNCTVTNMRINMVASYQTISGNTFVTSTAVSMFLSSIQNFNVSNNTGINDVYINGATGNGIFSGNTFDLNSAGWSPNIPILFGAVVTNTVFTSNTFHSRLAAFSTFVTGYGTDLTFSSNTFDFSVNPTGGGAQHTILDLSGSNITVTGNKMSFPISDAGTKFLGVYLFPANANADTSATINNNTMRISSGLNGSSSGPVCIWAGSNGTRNTTLSASYNICASTSTNPNSAGILLSKNVATNLTLTNDYNDFFNITTNLSLVGGASSSLGANTRTSDPYFKIKDASTANDLDVVPFSTFLNVNNWFIGADSGPRRTTIYVNPGGTINYSTVDATSTQDALNNLLSGDTINLAAGTYSAFTLASTTAAVTGLTITGAGSGTVINGSGSANALTLIGLDTCAVNNLLVQNAGTGFAGIKLATSASCTLSAVTSTNNAYGVWFATSSVDNTLNDSTITGSSAFDVYSVSASTNALKNTNFSFASSSITAPGAIDVYFKTRALAQTATSTPLTGITITFTDHNNSASTTLSTGAGGYTAYTSYVRAATLSSGSYTATSSGYNPYTITATATGTYGATSTQLNVATANQTVTLTLVTNTLAPSAPSSATVFSINTSTAGLSWIDNSSGNSQEDVFVIDYVSGTGNFPGTTSTVAADTTTTVLSGLSINSSYTVRVAARNNIGTSVYSTTSLFYTLALPPSAPSTTALGRTSVSVTINDSFNPTTTAYAIYDGVSASYVGANGHIGNGSPVWQTASVWGAPIAATSLTCNTHYSFAVKARNGDAVETAFSSSTDVTTDACAVVDNGGGGGGGGGNSGTHIITPPTSTIQKVTTSTVVTKNTTTTIQQPDVKVAPEDCNKTGTCKEPVKTKITDTKKPITKETTNDTVKIPSEPETTHQTTSPNSDSAPFNTSHTTTTVLATDSSATSTLLKLSTLAAIIASVRDSALLFTSSPEIKQAAGGPVPAGVVTITALGIAYALSWSDVLSLLRYLFLQPVIVLGKKRRRGWGQVYNALSKMPIDLATVRLLDPATKRVVQTRVTDRLGRYAFFARPGTYQIEVIKNNHTFPSILLSGFDEDGRRADIYHGEPLRVTEQEAVITANIPLDPMGETKKPRRLSVQRFLRTTQIILAWSGLTLTGISYIISPTWYVLGLFGLHALLLLVFKRLALPAAVKSWGVVYDATSKTPVQRAVVRLFNQQFNKLVETQITDNRGRYYFLAADARYFVTFEHPSYQLAQSNNVDISGKEEATISLDISLSRR